MISLLIAEHGDLQIGRNKMAKENQKEVFYVGLNDPRGVRKNVLESTRDLIQTIKSQDNLKQIRTQKFMLIEELKNQMVQVDNLMNRLKRALPSSRDKEQSIPMPKKKINAPRKIKDIDKLEAELADIEAKLSGM